MTTATPARRTQAQRRAQSRRALLETAARGLSRRGYADLVLEDVAAEAGYTRGALYHQFRNKEDLALAVVAWVEETWWAHMADALADASDPVDMLCAIAREHAVFCRRDIARVRMSLRVEFSERDHPVGRAVAAATSRVLEECTTLAAAARDAQLMPEGPPPDVLARAIVGAVEGLVIELAGQAPYDEQLAELLVLGVLGLPTRARPGGGDVRGT